MSANRSKKSKSWLTSNRKTAPVRDAYFAMGNSQLIGSLEQVQGFIAKAQYPSPMLALRPEWGSISNLRFLVSSIGSITQNASLLGQNVFNVFCTGLEAYASVEQDGCNIAVYKSSLMDFKTLAGNAEDKKAQAEAEMLLAA